MFSINCSGLYPAKGCMVTASSNPRSFSSATRREKALPEIQKGGKRAIGRFTPADHEEPHQIFSSPSLDMGDDVPAPDLAGPTVRVRRDIETLATGVEPDGVNGAGAIPADLGAEFEDFVRPIIGELKALTAKPREIEALRTNVARRQRQIEQANKPVSRDAGDPGAGRPVAGLHGL